MRLDPQVRQGRLVDLDDRRGPGNRCALSASVQVNVRKRERRLPMRTQVAPGFLRSTCTQGNIMRRPRNAIALIQGGCDALAVTAPGRAGILPSRMPLTPDLPYREDA